MPTFGDQEDKQALQSKIENDIDAKFQSYKDDNGSKRKNFIVRVYTSLNVFILVEKYLSLNNAHILRKKPNYSMTKC